MVLSLLLAFFGTFIIYVKASEKYYGIPEYKKKKKLEGRSILEWVRDLVSA
jgi:hypothetical protein